jgi:hypothetical protein
MNSEGAIRPGLNYAGILRLSFHCIEARFRRVFGPHHKITIEADEKLEKFKLRQVLVSPDNKLFHALRYENDGEICVVRGPIFEPRNIEEKRGYIISHTTL